MLHHINIGTIYHNCQEVRETFVPMYSSAASLKHLKQDHMPKISGLTKAQRAADTVGWSLVALEITAIAQLRISLD